MRKEVMGSHDYVQTLKGQKLRFPDFDHLLRTWPRGMSPHYEALKKIHEEELPQLLGPGSKRLEAAIAAEFSLNAATWWPTSSFDAVRFASYLVAWLYVWDNETDSPEFNQDVCLNLEAGEKFRAETREHIKAYLDDGNWGRYRQRPRTEKISSALASFNPVGEPAAFRMTSGQRVLFLRQLLRFVQATAYEQRSELSGVAPTIDEYLPTRMGTSGVETISACIEYMVNIDLGDCLRADPDIQTIYAENNCIISMMNDVFSLRRELRLAVLYHEYQDLQPAMGQIYEIVKASVSRLDSAAERLLERYPDRRGDLEAFITGAKTMCTGNIQWSIRNKRYNLGFSKCDGTAEIVI
ncbi:hypothetical protein PG999_008286 [Apiospora kogelbergensis]|uniref:Terpene synthase n=1 Tax=Apiospora kogelbergensis TaxID=1337665 RepID=A0AAW0QFX8_9PEZI